MATHPDPQGSVRYQIVLKPEQRQKIKLDAVKAGFPDVKKYILHKLGIDSNGKQKK